MRKIGVWSGVSTSFGSIVSILALAICLWLGLKISLGIFIFFTALAKLSAEYAFWYMVNKKRADYAEKVTIQFFSNRSILSHPNVVVSLVVLIVDTLADATLVFRALQISLQPSWVLLMLTCQAISSPIQGLCGDIYSRKKTLLFALFAGLLICVLFATVSIEIHTAKQSFFTLLGLSFTASTQMFIVLCLKGLLGNATPIARASIAEIIEAGKKEQLENQ